MMAAVIEYVEKIEHIAEEFNGINTSTIVFDYLT